MRDRSRTADDSSPIIPNNPATFSGFEKYSILRDFENSQIAEIMDSSGDKDTPRDCKIRTVKISKMSK